MSKKSDFIYIHHLQPAAHRIKSPVNSDISGGEGIFKLSLKTPLEISLVFSIKIVRGRVMLRVIKKDATMSETMAIAEMEIASFREEAEDSPNIFILLWMSRRV